MRIRKSNREDYDIIQNILHTYFGSSNGYDSTAEVEYLIAEADEIIGILCYSIYYDRMELNYIVTVEEYRKNGIAMHLLRELDRIGIETNCNSITLEVEKENVAAISLYEKNGYHVVSIRKNYYQGNDGLLMMKEWC